MGVLEEVLEELKEINQKMEQLATLDQSKETKMLNVDEAAQFLKLSTTKVYELMRQREIPFVKAGRRKLIPKQMLLEWIDQNAQDNQQVERIYQIK
ncbi:helix-turn-helix domain-containing protein [Natroniella sulfidigena]|uniref:helix-turn-helix domain-containing protein n=1 Tax=Natroniella sulfidigena TaxID=723921 RepID=UPI00200B0170|nr:helix-turn-helix domain-containing protein [Natroniella sulfidigena]MCK8817174.1 helix-turn-helix domain-containing protein [Natroniella sulfidigena]